MKELYSICWNITYRCNENCKFCYRKICKENSLKENKKIFDNLQNIRIGKITFAGGEPLLYENLFELVNYIHEKNPDIILSLTTNGKIIDDVLLEKIIKTFDWLTFSIDSSDENVNDVIGRGTNHLSKVINLLEKCNNRIKLKINTVVTKINVNDLINIYNIISKFNISRWKIFRFYPLRKGNENKELFYLSDAESKQVETTIHYLNQNDKIKIHYNDFDEFVTSYFNIFPDGSIENNDNECIGNLLDNSISDILMIKKQELTNHSLRRNYD